MLITSHGSHLTNGLFLTNPHTKAVIEVVASKFDAGYHSIYQYDDVTNRDSLLVILLIYYYQLFLLLLLMLDIINFLYTFFFF